MAQASISTTITVLSQALADVTFSIVENVLSAPLNALSRNAGNGALDVAWTAPATGSVGWYEVWLSSDKTTWVKATEQPVYNTWVRIPNLTLNQTVYAKVRAIGPDGTEGTFSAIARDAYIGRAVTRLRFDGIPGDVVPNGALYTHYRNGVLLGMYVRAGGTLS